MKDNLLIMGTVWGCEYQSLWPFFESLNRSGYEGRTVLFAHDMSGECHWDVDIEPFNPPPGMHMLNHRFRLYRDYLDEYRPYAVMLTDIRDVLVLSDPFNRVSESLNFFCEDASKTIETCVFNGNWVRFVFGEPTLQFIGKRPISCAGVTIGDHHGIYNYLSQMSIFVDRLQQPMLNLDQGIHNGLLWLGSFPGAKIWPNEGAPVMTMGYMPGPLNLDVLSSRPAVLHQYDRHPDFAQQFFKEYLA
jgi:hypothetical protein